jgi:hypothetical protein
MRGGTPSRTARLQARKSLKAQKDARLEARGPKARGPGAALR